LQDLDLKVVGFCVFVFVLLSFICLAALVFDVFAFQVSILIPNGGMVERLGFVI